MDYPQHTTVLPPLLRGISANLHNLGVAFIGMLIQLPLIVFTKRFEKADSPTKKMIGNCIFWVTFTTFGQPFAALCYFYAWQIKFGSISEKWNSSQAEIPGA